MSNPNVGQVYAQIIRDVVEASRLDFEEGGVDESVLDELSEGWQRKLSALGVAQFPWDTKTEPSQIPVGNPPAANSNYQQVNTPPVSQLQSTFSIPPLPSMQPMNDNSNGPVIKNEPGFETGLPLPSYSAPLTAQQRAAQNLAATFGPRAAASISAIQNGIPQQSQQQIQQQNQPQNTQLQQQQQQQQRSGASAQRPPLTQTQYQQSLAIQAAQRAQLQGQGGVNGAQTDGTSDMDSETVGIMKQINAKGQEVEMGRVEIDHMIRRKIEAMGQSMEGGGLMLPLKERFPGGRTKKRKTIDSRAPAPVHGLAASSTSTMPPRYDGGDDDDDDRVKDEDLDEDAINSELDDSDDGGNEEEDDDDSMGHIMLCMYDKVQRVKNKWKCVMKDGVLTVNGKEYVFHKATGEYEW